MDGADDRCEQCDYGEDGNVPGADAARSIKGPLDCAELTLDREDMLAAQVAELTAVVTGQSLIVARYQFAQLVQDQAEDVRKLQGRHAALKSVAMSELASLEETAKLKEGEAKRVWRDLSSVYGVDFATHTYDDSTGVISSGGQPVARQVTVAPKEQTNG